MYDRLVAAGAAVRPAPRRAEGARAACAWRRATGTTGTTSTTPTACSRPGSGFFVDLDKPGGFVGRDAVMAAKAAGPLARRLVQVLVTDPEPLMFHAEVVHRDGQPVGYVRAASYGHTLGGAVGLAMVEARQPVTQAYLDEGVWEVDIAGRRYPAVTSIKPLYDPEMKRVPRLSGAVRSPPASSVVGRLERGVEGRWAAGAGDEGDGDGSAAGLPAPVGADGLVAAVARVPTPPPPGRQDRGQDPPERAQPGIGLARRRAAALRPSPPGPRSCRPPPRSGEPPRWRGGDPGCSSLATGRPRTPAGVTRAHSSSSAAGGREDSDPAKRRTRWPLSPERAHGRWAPWVGGLEGRPQALGGDLRVHLGRGDRGMAEQLLHDTQVGAVVEHVGGARVPEHVGAERPAETGPGPVAGDDGPPGLAGEPTAALVEEHRFRVTAAGPALRAPCGAAPTAPANR